MGKKSLVCLFVCLGLTSWSPGQVKFQVGQAYIFTQCPVGK